MSKQPCLKCDANLAGIPVAPPTECGDPIPANTAFAVSLFCGKNRWRDGLLCGPCLRHTYGSLIYRTRKPAGATSPSEAT